MSEVGQHVSDWAAACLIGERSQWAKSKFRDGSWANVPEPVTVQVKLDTKELAAALREALDR